MNVYRLMGPTLKLCLKISFTESLTNRQDIGSKPPGHVTIINLEGSEIWSQGKHT